MYVVLTGDDDDERYTEEVDFEDPVCGETELRLGATRLEEAPSGPVRSIEPGHLDVWPQNEKYKPIRKIDRNPTINRKNAKVYGSSTTARKSGNTAGDLNPRNHTYAYNSKRSIRHPGKKLTARTPLQSISHHFSQCLQPSAELCCALVFKDEDDVCVDQINKVLTSNDLNIASLFR
ncbi:hypothetical protein CLF_103462, partial [Clonorchis sinensis]